MKPCRLVRNSSADGKLRIMGWMDAPEVKPEGKVGRRPEVGQPVIATTQDGGKVYRCRMAVWRFPAPAWQRRTLIPLRR